MAQYFTEDWSSLAAWTLRYRATTNWTAANPLTIPNASASDWNAITWDVIDGDGDRDDVEILVLFTTATAWAKTPFILRASGADESPTFYTIRLDSGDLLIRKYVGSETGATVATAASSHSVSTDYWLRFRANGTTISAKIWADGGSEPGSWTVSGTDSDIAAAGWVGIAASGSSGGGIVVKKFGVGTNGDTAPSAVAAGSAVARRSFPRSILNF